MTDIDEELPKQTNKPWWRWTRRICGAVLLLLLLLVLVWFRGALYHRFIRFPREEAAWRALRAERQAVPRQGDWNEYRGILHAHSKLSHDSEMPVEEILRVLKATGIDFIGLSDHPIDGRADFDLQWRGLHDGKLFIPGFEMKDGIMPFGVAAGVVLSNQTDAATLARQISEHGGLLFYAHSEEPRDWERPQLVGMEIYNIHTDLKRSRHGLLNLLPDVLLNQSKYPDQVFRTLFHRPTDLLRRWDELNRKRHITGIAGNDAHQNVGLRATYTSSDSIRLDDTSPKPGRDFKLNWLTRWLARMCFGPLEPNRVLFHVQLDPYERSARFV
ncbi:MAG TPA: PHP domain-containing protein, partial [Verrucomicrobiae bacterium]|nr:PHP domain-containing protein [Verrucomicrobiae bacterium]